MILTGIISKDEIDTALKSSLVKKLIDLIRIRNSHPAFGGEFYVEAPEEYKLEMRWEQNNHWMKLHVDLSVPSAVIIGSNLEEEIIS